MIKVVRVVPAGYRVVIEHEFDELKKLRDGLSQAEFDIAGQTEEVKAGMEFITEVFFPELDRLIKEIDSGIS